MKIQIIRRIRYQAGRIEKINGENKKYETKYDIYCISGMSMFALLIIILVTSIQIAIYGDPEYHFYQKEYEKYTVAEALDMKISDLMEVTEHMMAYLDGKEEKLSVEVPVEGKMQDFFNRQDREHMADVQVLFHKGRIVRRFATAVAAFLLAVLYVCKKYLKIKDRQTEGVQAKQWRLRTILFRGYTTALGIFAAIVAVIAAACVRDFSATFTLFHELIFTNKLWLFDEGTDYMIRMLPEGFFSDMAFRILLTFGVAVIILWAMLFIWNCMCNRKSSYMAKNR